MKKRKMHILSCVWSPLLVAQFVIVFFLGIFNEAELDLVMYVGWVIWVISLILGWLPIFILKRRGGVPTGKGYVHTTRLVDSGLYSIVRHPQYTAGILLSISLILISQSWLILAIGVLVILLLYIDILMTDKHELEKFGEEYKLYMKRVPRTNFILGIIRLLRRGSNEGK
ncbi:MAG: isoprenylcysteine carboxylmethyltransferase family protein [Methanomassiliicoccales archaeon]|nr:isoprenylcysteine carboxylmethyltransferase family protein [Methanomassiliicoccales archaeon]NYT15370.1 isoprenylcysteine carboxylmethyltransferase family protein [Methanomassiliicoccales archaeon]